MLGCVWGLPKVTVISYVATSALSIVIGVVLLMAGSPVAGVCMILAAAGPAWVLWMAVGHVRAASRQPGSQ